MVRGCYIRFIYVHVTKVTPETAQLRKAQGQGERNTVACVTPQLRVARCPCVSCVRSATQSCPTLRDPMDYVACQAPLSMEFSR